MNGSNDYSMRVIARVRELRQQRGYSASRLAELATAQGCPITRDVVAGWEVGRRRYISVDELLALARALAVSLDRLLVDVCPACLGNPPLGYTCNHCGLRAGEPEASDHDVA